jgi:SHS2 domain-containing protein
MGSHGFEEIDHTADLALRVWGKDFYDLLEQAAKGLYHLLEVDTLTDPTLEHTFFVEESARETMLVDFLNELLYLCEEREAVFQTFTFVKEGEMLRVQSRGKRTASIGRYIKAVTFHNLEIQDQESILTTTLTFDV